MKKETLNIYVHIPFCVKKCPYCSFTSFSPGDVPEKEYTECILGELSYLLKRENLKCPVETVYFGGGTPSIFSPDSIKRILEGIGKKLPLLKDVSEVTLEVNPDTVDKKKLLGFKNAGINRLSIGVQSFNEGELKKLERTHSAGKGELAFLDARDSGFKNIGIDLIFAIPGQTLPGFERSLSKTIKLRPEHVSIYALTVEEGTPYSRAFKKGGLRFPPEKLCVDMYLGAIGLLKENGYTHYEISNLALPGFESRHNTACWLGKNYLGLGAGAHSYLRYPGWGRRWWNRPYFPHYMEALDKKGSHVLGKETLKEDSAKLEAIFLGLRLLKGIGKNGFKKRFGSPPEAFLQWERLTELGLVKDKGDRISLTEKGILFSNEVF